MQQYFAKNKNLELEDSDYHHIKNVIRMKKDDIIKRAKSLTMKALEIWPYFGSEEVASDVDSKSYSTPQSVYCLGRYSKVRSWRDVLTFTLETLYEELPEYFEQIVKTYPKWFANVKRF